MRQGVCYLLLSVPANDAEEVLLLCTLGNLSRHFGIGVFPKWQAVVKAGGCKVFTANVGRAIRLADTSNMLIARRFVLLAAVQEDRVAPAFHHAAEVDDFGGISATDVLSRAASVWQRRHMKSHSSSQRMFLGRPRRRQATTLRLLLGLNRVCKRLLHFRHLIGAKGSLYPALHD